MPPERVADCRRVKPAQRPQIKETFWKTCAIGQSALKQAANALLSESQGPSARDETWKGARLTEDSVGKVCTLEAISYGLASAGIQSIYPAQLGWQQLATGSCCLRPRHFFVSQYRQGPLTTSPLPVFDKPLAYLYSRDELSLAHSLLQLFWNFQST